MGDLPTIELIHQIASLDCAAEDERNRHKQAMTRINAQLKDWKRMLHEMQAGLDGDKLALGRTIVDVRGRYTTGGEDRYSVIEDACHALAQGGGPLWREAFGTKSYDRWYGQRSDHRYGFGPKHGTTIFSIGLKRDVLRREPKELSPQEMEAACYIVANLERIETASEESEAA